MRQISNSCAALLVQWEGGFVLTPYQDNAGVWTDGAGNTHGVVPNGPAISLAQAQTEFAANIAPAEQCVDSLVTVALSDNQFGALVSFTFNEGIGAFSQSSALAVLNQGDYTDVPAHLALWNKIHVNGQLVVSKGMINRRAAEIVLWNTP